MPRVIKASLQHAAALKLDARVMNRLALCVSTWVSVHVRPGPRPSSAPCRELEQQQKVVFFRRLAVS